jgi:hypothetical protein
MSAGGGFTVAPDLGLILWTVYWFAAVAAAAVCGLKGRWISLLVGLFTLGLLWFVGATFAAEPESAWERWGSRRRARRS